jgi:hypothetical protein
LFSSCTNNKATQGDRLRLQHEHAEHRVAPIGLRLALLFFSAAGIKTTASIGSRKPSQASKTPQEAYLGLLANR